MLYIAVKALILLCLRLVTLQLPIFLKNQLDSIRQGGGDLHIYTKMHKSQMLT